ncbi:uncharacterized protein LOC108913978 isoform X2 [Anoplophora glabripennis]|nr:uncharacterized protein LOC108913978 isoform X2 [Anoplophora glabripennis]
MREVVELNCGHKYCKECYLEQKSAQKQASCPLCKRIYKRRSIIYSDNYASTLGKFVYNCCENIKSIYKCEVEQLRKQLREEIEIPQNKDVLQQNVISNNNSLAIPSTSKGINQTIKQKNRSKEKYGIKKANKKKTQDESVKENCMNAFDTLMSNQPTNTFNRKGTKRVYINKKKYKKDKAEYNILEFDNCENKTAVLKWLNDTRNQFDRLSQTQNITGISEVPVIDLVSVSQVKGAKDECKSMRPKLRRGRAKSLDIEVKKVIPTQKKLNLQTRSTSLENYNIEDNTEEEEVVKKAEEKVIQDLIEDEFLKALDNELQETKYSDFDIKSKRYNSSRKKTKPLSPTPVSTGWERLTEIEKTIKKNERIPKQLNITLQSTQELKNENTPQISNKETIIKATNTDKPNSDSKQNTTRNNVVGIESKNEHSTDKESNGHKTIDVDKRNDDSIQSVIGNKEALIENKSRPPEDTHAKNRLEENIPEANKNPKHSYDLEQLEDYISKNIELIDKNTSGDNDTLIHAFQQKKIKAHAHNSENLTKKPTSENVEKKTTKSEDSCVLLDVLFNVPPQKMPHDDNSKSKQENEVIVIDDVPEIEIMASNVQNNRTAESRRDVLFNMPTQKISHDNSNRKQENEVVVIEDICEIEPTQPNLRDDRTPKNGKDVKQDTSLDEITKLYACPTQKIDYTSADTTNKHSSTEDLLYLSEECLEKCITSLKSTDVTIENHLRNLQFYLSKLKLLHRNDNKVIKEKACITELCDAETQVVINIADKTIQTEVKGNSIGVQTEDLCCIQCNVDLNKNLDGVTLISQGTRAAIEHMVNETNTEFKPTLRSGISNKTALLKQGSQREMNLDFNSPVHSTGSNKNNTPLKRRSQHTVNETDIDFKPIPQSTVSNKNYTSAVKQRSQHEEFTCTLDNLSFDTQEIEKNQDTITKIPSKIDSRKSDAPQTSRADIGYKVEENIPSSVLICSLNSNKSTASKKINRKLTYEDDKSSKFKRIKRPASDSDSEEDEEVPAKRKCNRFLRDDLSVQFLTNPDISEFKENNKTLVVESQDSESINYDEYLAEVMKKYEDNDFSSSSPRSFKKPKVLTAKQELNRKCEEMIDNANKKIYPGKSVSELSCASSKDSFRTASDSNNFGDGLGSDDVFMNEENLLKLENDIRTYERKVKAQNSEISDIIGETEEITPSPKKRKKTSAKNDPPSNKDLFLRKHDLELSNKLCNALETDANELADTSEAQTNLKKEKNIIVLANVKIKSQDRNEVAKGDEDDLFSDEDIVETTPQKKVDSFADRSLRSQIMDSINLINNALPPPKETANFDFDIVPLPPPPDFQDDLDIPSTPEDIVDNDNPTNDDDNPTNDATTVIDLNKSSQTPDNLSQFIFRNPRNPKVLSPCIKQIIRETEVENKKSETRNISYEELNENDLSLTPDRLTQRNEHAMQRLLHSTPIVKVDLERESLGFSPITAKKSQNIGMTEMAQASKYTPLTAVTKHTPQKQNVFTSTPRQKSIWNYVKPSQEAGPSIGKTKPCIACTRLTKAQINLIVKLTDKKLARFNSRFDKDVTHMIVIANEENCVKDYTIKFVSAVASGIWVLKFEWVEECLKKGCIIPEEPFEVLDISGFPGPRTSRLTRKQNPLFKGYKFFCAEPFLSTTKDEIENIAKMLGGRVLQDMRSLLVDDGDIGIIIGEGHATQDFEQYERWVEKYKTVTVDIEWLSKCVGQYKILSIRPYVWCSEDNLGDLGYPSALTETVPLSFTETF